MRRARLLLAVLLWSVPGFSQAPNNEEKRGVGYLFFAPGAGIADGSLALMHFGGGGEGLIKRGFGASAEIGYVFPPRAGFGEGLGVFAPGVLYRFKRETKTTPFVTGGWGLAFREGAYNLVHFGGGVDHWLTERLGLRIEGRDFMDAKHPDYHLLQARIGLVIR